MDFKVGDTVVCVKRVQHLELGQIYKIKEIYKSYGGKEFIYVFKGDHPDGYLPERFKKVDLTIFSELGD